LKKPKYRIGSETFATKRAIIDRAKGILAHTDFGGELTGDDLAFMLALLQRHPKAERKIGPGVRAIRVELNTHWTPRKAFVLVRVDSSETDFSFYSCVSKRPARADFNAACRTSVVEDVLAFKQWVFDAGADAENKVACAITGERVGWDEAHVDHAPPWTFKAIVDSFASEIEVDAARVPLTGDGDNECRSAFADAEMAERFRRFHNERARLRVVTNAANLSRRG